MTEFAAPQEFVKKPVVIEAMQLSGGASETHTVMDWMEGNLYPFLVGDALRPESLRYPDQAEGDDTRPDKGHYIDPATGHLMIRTPEGDMAAKLGWWVIQGVQGEFYPCSPDVFEKTYERAA